MLHESTVACVADVAPGSRYGIVHVRGEIDLASLPSFRESFTPMLDTAPVILVSLDGVGHLSAAGVRFLLDMRSLKEAQGGGLPLVCGDHRPARLVLRALGVPVIAVLPTWIGNPS